MENPQSKEDQIKKFFCFSFKKEMLTKKICQKNVLKTQKKMTESWEKASTSKRFHWDFRKKKSSGKFRYTITPILFEEKPFQIVECGKMKIFSFHNKSFSVGLTVDKENEDYFKSIEKRISDLFASRQVFSHKL